MEDFNYELEMANQNPPANPHEGHLACVLLVDTSGSMQWDDRIGSLNRGIEKFINETNMDELARSRVDVSIISFNTTVTTVVPFTPLRDIQPVTLTAEGCTCMGAAIEEAIHQVKARTTMYGQMGTPRFNPWIVMISDGAPTDSIEHACEMLEQERLRKDGKRRIKFIPVGVPGYSMEAMSKLAPQIIELENADFSHLFNWISKSMVLISNSDPSGEAMPADFEKDGNMKITQTQWEAF